MRKPFFIFQLKFVIATFISAIFADNCNYGLYGGLPFVEKECAVPFTNLTSPTSAKVLCSYSTRTQPQAYMYFFSNLNCSGDVSHVTALSNFVCCEDCSSSCETYHVSADIHSNRTVTGAPTSKACEEGIHIGYTQMPLYQLTDCYKDNQTSSILSFDLTFSANSLTWNFYWGATCLERLYTVTFDKGCNYNRAFENYLNTSIRYSNSTITTTSGEPTPSPTDVVVTTTGIPTESPTESPTDDTGNTGSDLIIECSNVYSCAFRSRLWINTTANAKCTGYFSCYYIYSIEMTHMGGIECDGSYSCYFSSFITRDNGGLYQGEILCNGLFSCSWVEVLKNNDGSILCNGESSCVYSNIYPSTSLHCSGVESCSYASIYAANDCYMSGYLASKDSIFIARGIQSNFYFYGTSSAYNTQIVCNNSQICNITCFSGSCNTLTLSCDSYSYSTEDDGSSGGRRLSSTGGEDGNCTFNVACPDGHHSLHSNSKSSVVFSIANGHSVTEENICINYNNDKSTSVFGFSVPDISNISLTDWSLSLGPCSSYHSVIMCDNYQECKRDLLDTTYDLEPICCVAGQACENAINITSFVVVNDSAGGEYSEAYPYNVAIRCDGAYSCANVGHFIRSKNEGHIYFSGYYAAGNGTLESTSAYSTDGYETTDYPTHRPTGIPTEANEYTRVWANGNDVFCSGGYSCVNVSIENTRNVYCLSNSSCVDAQMEGLDGSAWFYGYQSGSGVNVQYISNDVYCTAYQACSNSSIGYLEGSVYGTAANALEGSFIGFVNDSVVATGYRSLYYAFVYSVRNVCQLYIC